MNFTYNELKGASMVGERVGRWNDLNVYAASVSELDDYGSGAYLILYDDDNRLVKKNDKEQWYSYGWVDSNGNVHEYDSLRRYKKTPVFAKMEEEQVEEVIADVKIGIDVDKVLQAAREMTVDSLLEGFNYGLD